MIGTTQGKGLLRHSTEEAPTSLAECAEEGSLALLENFLVGQGGEGLLVLPLHRLLLLLRSFRLLLCCRRGRLRRLRVHIKSNQVKQGTGGVTAAESCLRTRGL